MRIDRPTAAEAIARYRAEPGIDRRSFLGRGTPGSELLATRDAEAYLEWLGPRPLVRWIPGQSEQAGGHNELRGLVLRGGHGSTGLAVDNPWGLPPMTDPEQVIRQLWEPAATYIPMFVDQLAKAVFAIAEVRCDDREYLAYIMATWISSDVRDRLTVASIEELMNARKVTVHDVWGTAPLQDHEPTVVGLGEPLPAPLRAIAKTHASVTIFNPETYIDLGGLEPYRNFVADPYDPKPRDSLPDGNYVVFAGQTDCWYVLNFDRRDDFEEPTVAHHDPNDLLVLGRRKPLRWFLAHEFPKLLDADS